MRDRLVTSRLRLRLVGHADLAELHAIFSDPATHTIGDGPFGDLARTREWIERRIRTYRSRRLAWYAVRAADTGELIGNCGIFVGRTGPGEPEIGYEISRAWQGRGFATEAAGAVVAEAERAGIGRLWATVRPANVASLRVLARVGMTVQRTETDRKGELVFLARPAA